MIQQDLKGHGVSGWLGALMIVGFAVSIVLVSWIERAIALTTGFQYGAFAVWALVVVEAMAVMRLSVMAYRYTIADGRFFVERVYGDHARITCDIPLKTVLAIGERDDIFKRYGGAQAYDKAVMKETALPEMALAYAREKDEAAGLLLIQPNGEILNALREAARANEAEAAE